MSGERVAVVTGAAQGMGRAIGARLARDGFHPVLIDVLGPKAVAAATELSASGYPATGLALDLTDEAAVAALPERLGGLYDRVAVLVNNAGISPKREGRRVPAGDIELPEWERVVRVNLTAPFRLSQLLLPPMRSARWGRIVNISSRGGRSPAGVAGAHYVATKSGLLGLTRAFAKELAADGITVNAVAPGRIETPMTAGSPPEVIAAAVATIPVGRIGIPDDIAALVSYLASEGAGFVTGATFDINGGTLMI
ncbi:SDR family oxidoreductase [Muricoccus radiodurans]|uniref:SDR family oxidoreductase n=1 Tax=Muricoccus radiodurans TaxID=2231721 RepID=UPI003CF9B4DA